MFYLLVLLFMATHRVGGRAWFPPCKLPPVLIGLKETCIWLDHPAAWKSQTHECKKVIPLAAI